MNIRKLRWMENGPTRLDIDHHLLVVGVTDTYLPELFDGGVLLTTGGGLHEGQYLAADEAALEEFEVGTIFRSCIPEVARDISNQFADAGGTEKPDVLITGEVVRGEFLVEDVIVAGERLIREELTDILKLYNLESIDDQFLGYH